MNMIVKDTTINALMQTRPSVLGEAQARIPVGGRIRSGIKVLIRRYAEESQEAVKLYDRGVAAGAPFDIIDKTIIRKCKFKGGAPRTVLTPKNVPYFTVRGSDFVVPEYARKLFEMYATADGEHGRQLYRFPVIFPMDNWQAIMPHQFACYTSGERLYWSEYGADGARLCMTHKAVEMVKQKDRKGQDVMMAHRPAGGREVILRPDNNGQCNPDECPQYQCRECTLSGRVLFYIPGLPGTSAIELPTRSFYSLNQIRQTLEMVAFVTGGRVSGVFNGQPIFYLTKREQEVSMIDPATGKVKRVKQFLIALESTLDMTRMYQAAEAPARLAAGERAAAVLSGPAPTESHPVEKSAPGGRPDPVTVSHSGDDSDPFAGSEFEPEEGDVADLEFDPQTGELIDNDPPPDVAAGDVPAAETVATNVGAPLTLEEILASVGRARNTDELNEALDCARGLNDEAQEKVKRAAAIRGRELAKGI